MLPGGTDGRTTNKQGKIVLLSQWTLEAEFRKKIKKDERRKVEVMASFGIFLHLAIICLFTAIQLAKGTEMYYICQTSFQWILSNPPHKLLSPYYDEIFKKSREIESYLRITDFFTDFSTNISTNFSTHLSTDLSTGLSTNVFH